MLESLFGNSTVEKILFYMLVYNNSYAKRMADSFGIPVNGIQQQLKRLEEGGILVNQLKGKTRLYQFNPRYPFLKGPCRFLRFSALVQALRLFF